MPIQPADFAALASALYKGDRPAANEACARTIAGRAYYAAYLAVRDLVRTEYGNPRFDVGHTALADGLLAAPDSEVQDVGDSLRSLRIAREQSDYSLGLTVDRNRAGLMLNDAQNVLRALPGLAGKIPAGIIRR